MALESSPWTACLCNSFIKCSWKLRRTFQKLLHEFSWPVQYKMVLTPRLTGLRHLYIFATLFSVSRPFFASHVLMRGISIARYVLKYWLSREKV